MCSKVLLIKYGLTLCPGTVYVTSWVKYPFQSWGKTFCLFPLFVQRLNASLCWEHSKHFPLTRPSIEIFFTLLTFPRPAEIRRGIRSATSWCYGIQRVSTVVVTNSRMVLDGIVVMVMTVLVMTVMMLMGKMVRMVEMVMGGKMLRWLSLS